MYPSPLDIRYWTYKGGRNSICVEIVTFWELAGGFIQFVCYVGWNVFFNYFVLHHIWKYIFPTSGKAEALNMRAQGTSFAKSLRIPSNFNSLEINASEVSPNITDEYARFWCLLFRIIILKLSVTKTVILKLSVRFERKKNTLFLSYRFVIYLTWKALSYTKIN